MKKRIAVLMSVAVLLLCGCAHKNPKETYPAYFSPIVQELEASWEELLPYVFVMDTWWEEGVRTGEYIDKTYICNIDEEPQTFDLKDYLTEGEEWHWQNGGIFRREGEDRTYICLVDFNMMYEEGIVQNPEVLLIDYATKNPKDYRVTPYEVNPTRSLNWLTQCYRIGDNIYIASDIALGVIHLNTREFYLCKEEYSTVKEYVKDKFGEDYGMWFFKATLEQDGVIVYSAEVAEAFDETAIGAVFAAFKDNKPIGYMYVDFTADNFADAIEMETVK